MRQVPQIPTPTQDNVLACLAALKTNIDWLLGRQGTIGDDRLLTLLENIDSKLNADLLKLTLKRLVLEPYNDYGSPRGKSLPGEIINSLAGSLFVGRGSTVWGQILDSGATLRGGSWAFTSGSNQVIPRGFYIATPVSGGVRLDINDSGWQTGNANFTGGLLASDGTNVRLFETGASTATVDYLQVGP